MVFIFTILELLLFRLVFLKNRKLLSIRVPQTNRENKKHFFTTSMVFLLYFIMPPLVQRNL